MTSPTELQRRRLTVNGLVREAELEGDTPLLYALRGEWGLCGTRFGCGEGSCSACLVLVDGRPATSCDLPLWSVEGASVVTVEGLAGADGTPSAVQAAFLAEQAGQCGYCLSGMLVAATALLARDPRPTDAQIRTAMERVLCRCGTHNAVIRAVRRAADDR